MDNFFRYSDIANEVYSKSSKGIKHKRTSYEGIAIDEMEITDSNNEYKKDVGRYILLDSKIDIEGDDDNFCHCLTKHLKKLIRGKSKNKTKVLIVGLGNKDYNPDSLGPKVVDNIIVNSHLEISDKYRVSAFCPGVMGQTGMESSRMIKAIVKEEKIDLVIAIDALATRTIRRLNKVIQLTDTGVSPGSGVGNYRQVLNYKYIGVPVIAIGVATVIDTIAIVVETLNNIEIEEKLKRETMTKISKMIDEQIVVATKDIDKRIVDIATIIARALNNCFE